MMKHKEDSLEDMELTEEQRLYLQRIFDFLREQNRWPTYRALDQWFTSYHVHLDIEEIWKSLPPGLTNVMDLNQPESRATLTVPAIYLLENNHDALTAFLEIVKLGVNTYLHSPDGKLEISSKSILQKDPLSWDIAVRQAGALLSVEPNIWLSFTGPDLSGHWQCTLAREVRRFRGIVTIEEYLEKRDLPRQIVNPSSIVSTPDTSIPLPAQFVRLHPDIHTKCWSSYTRGDYDNAIFNATKAIEVAVRSKARLPDDLVGASLIAQAFRTDSPILTYSTVKAEQEGMMALLRGMILVYKNPQSHRHVGVQNKSECLGILLVCSSLLYIIDTL
jgi:uncharacterized protein (TIGR02391 family)